MASGLIGGLVAAVLLSVVAWFANRRKPGEAGLTFVAYGVAMKVIALLCLAGSTAILALVIWSRTEGNPTATPQVTLLFAGLLIATMAGVFDAFTRRIDWSPDGIRVSLWGRSRNYDWADVAAFDLRPVMQYACVCFRDGRGIAVNQYMTGARELDEELRERGVAFTVQGRPEGPPSD